MYRFDRRFCLPTLAVGAILWGCFPTLAQTASVQPAKAILDSGNFPANATGPSFVPTSDDIGDALMIHQRYQAAIEAYSRDPDRSPVVWNRMGIAYQMLFDLRDAIRCFQESLKRNPKNPSVLNNLGTVYNSMKEYGQAERAYRKAIALNPHDALIYRNLGTALLAQHKFQKGWDAYQRALELDPNIFQNRPGPAVENPGSAQDRGAMNYYMARGCVRAGMKDRAIDYLRKALNEGFASAQKIVGDTEFAGLKGTPDFDRLLAAQDRH